MSNLSTQIVTIDDVMVRIDVQGRYCLNDLHKAAMAAGKATESHAPAQFLKTDKVQAFVAVLDAEYQCEENHTAQKVSDATKIASVKSINGGKSPGTYAVEIVAIRYAAWIDPAFEVRVYRTFQKATKGNTDWRKLRSAAASSNKVMNAMLQDVRAAIGKATEAKHYMCEAKLVNWAHSGQFTKLDRDSLNLVELELLSFLEMKNTALTGRNVPYETRKTMLKEYAFDWRMTHIDMIELKKEAA